MARSFSEGMEEFLDATYDLGGEALPTRIELVPPCETKGTITDIALRKFPSRQDEGEFQALVNIMFTINDPNIKEETGLDEPRVQYTIRLDTERGWDGNGNPPLVHGKNKNVGLGRFLTAMGMNDGRKWKWSTFMHEECWIKVQKPYNPESPYSEVAMVGATEDDVKRGSAKR